MSQPICVSTREVQSVLELLSVGGPIELTAAGIARTLGSPVTSEVVKTIMKRSVGVLARRPEAIAQMILEAKREGETVRQFRQHQANEGVFSA
jgi:hypothetical protein